MTGFSTWPVRQVEEERRRLEVLRALAVTPAYRLQAAILRDQMCAIGIPTTHDQMITCTAWLAEQGMVQRETGPSGDILRLTRAGRDVAYGFSSHTHIAQPDP